jgi:tellurite resistance protein
MTPLLLNAARAFAMVSYADGTLAPAEAQRFARVAEKDPAFATAGHAEIADAWIQASREVHEAQSFGSALLSIRSEMAGDEEKALIMRIAQAAVVADGKLDPQENKAIGSLAEALGLDPSKY